MTSPETSAAPAIPEEASSKPHKNTYVLLCDSMTCLSCEEAIEKSLKELPNIEAVKANRASGTITVTKAKGCASCAGSCSCCNCSPCSCETCRCCSCGVDELLKVLEDIDHHATYPQIKTSPSAKIKRISDKINGGIKSLPQVNVALAVAFGVGCFAVGYMAKKY